MEKKTFTTILIIFFSAMAALGIVKNNGAHIKVIGGTFVNVENSDFENENNGTVRLEGDADFEAHQNFVNTSGTVSMNGSSLLTVELDYSNFDDTFIYDTSRLIVKDNVINSGYINNEHFIEIGE